MTEETTKGTEQRQLHPSKIDWIGAVRQTISDAQVRVVSGNKAETLYFRNYKEGTHMVVTANGVVKDQQVLITQYAPELSKQEFQGAVVEKTRDSRQAPQGSPGAVGIRTQPQPQTVQTPQPGTQGNDTAEGGLGQAENVASSVPESEAGGAAVPSVESALGNVTPVTEGAPAGGPPVQAPGVAGDSNMTLSLVQNDSRNLPDLIELAGRPGKGKEWAETAPLTAKQRQLLEEATGQSLDQYTRAVDRGGLRQVYTQHGPGSEDAHPITEEDLQALPEIVTSPGAVMVDPGDGLGYTTLRHMRFHNGWWYQYTEEVRGGKSGQKALVLTDLSKTPGEAMANDEVAAGAGVAKSQTMMAEAGERLREASQQLRDESVEEDGQDEQGDGVHLDEGGREEVEPTADLHDAAYYQRLARVEQFHNVSARVLTPERREAASARLFPAVSRSLETKFNNQATQIAADNMELDEAELETRYEALYQEIFKDATVSRTAEGAAEHPAYAVIREESRITQAYKEAMKRPEVAASHELKAQERRRCIDGLNGIPGGPVGALWGIPDADIYGHALDSHGEGNKGPENIRDKAADVREPKAQVGLFLDVEFAAAVIGAIIKRGPGVHDVPVLPGFPAEVYLPDRSGPYPADVIRVVVRPDGKCRTAYPCCSRFPRTRAKKVEQQ